MNFLSFVNRAKCGANCSRSLSTISSNLQICKFVASVYFEGIRGSVKLNRIPLIFGSLYVSKSEDLVIPFT